MIPDDRKSKSLPRAEGRLLVMVVALLGMSSAMAKAAADDDLAPQEFPQPVEAERAAAEAVRALGGWYELDNDRHVVELNMVYHEDPHGRRQDNDQNTDEVLVQLPKFPRLKLLLLKEGQASDEGLVYVGRLHQLEKLYIWSASGVTDAGISHLHGLSKLSYVHLSGSQATDEAILHLSKLPLIEGISMQQTACTDKALDYAARMPRLRSLILDRGAKFTDEGMQRIREMPMLEELWLQDAGITEEGLKSLHGLPKLEFLVFNESDVGALAEDAIEELQQASPNVRVSLGGKVLPSKNALRVADDPKLQELVRRDAIEGLKIIEQFLGFLAAKQDANALELSRYREVVARMQGLRQQPDFEPLKISVANGSSDTVLALTSPAVTHELFDGQGNVRERRTVFVGLRATRKQGIWRVDSYELQNEGSNTWMERFVAEHPDAQKLR